MFDLNTINSVENMVYYDPNNYFNNDEYTEIKSIVFNQLEDLENLGQDFIESFEFSNDEIKTKIFKDIIDYVQENYLVLADKDYILNSKELNKNGHLIYRFVCVDCFNILIPKILESFDLQSIIQYDKLISRKELKTVLIDGIKDILENLLKLQKIDTTIKEDKYYQTLVERFGYYLELVDFSNSDKFNTNFVRPVLNKHIEQLLWRTL